MSIARQRINKHTFLTTEAVFSSWLVVVENWVEFWNWQSKVNEKKGQERN
jgi:hypothetical protein